MIQRPTQPYLAYDSTITRPKGLFAHLNQNCWNVATLHGMACGLGGHNNKKLLTATSLLSIIFATVGMLVIQATWLSLLWWLTLLLCVMYLLGTQYTLEALWNLCTTKGSISWNGPNHANLPTNIRLSKFCFLSVFDIKLHLEKILRVTEPLWIFIWSFQ